MRPFVHRPQSITSHVSVDLRRSHIGVSEQLLNRSEIGSAFEQMRRVGVPQRVRMQGPAVGERMAVEDPAGVTGRQPAAPRRSRRAPSVGSPTSEPGRACRTYAATASHAGLAEREPADLRTLAEHGDRAAAQVDGVDVEAAALAHPEPGAVEQLEQREVARATAGIVARSDVGRLGGAVEQRGRVARGAAPAAASCGPCGVRRPRGDVAARAHRAAAGSARTRAPTRPCAAIVGLREPARLQVREVAPQHAVVERRPRSGQPPRSHHATNSSTSCAYARRVCSLTPVSDDGEPVRVVSRHAISIVRRSVARASSRPEPSGQR